MMGRTPVSRISSAVCWICSSLVAASAGGGGCGCSVGIGFIGPIVGPPMAALLLLRERCEKSKRRGVPPSTRENPWSWLDVAPGWHSAWLVAEWSRFMRAAPAVGFRCLSREQDSRLTRPYASAALVRNSACRSSRARSEEHTSEEHTSELQSLMRISYAVFCLQKKNKNKPT